MYRDQSRRVSSSRLQSFLFWGLFCTLPAGLYLYFLTRGGEGELRRHLSSLWKLADSREELLTSLQLTLTKLDDLQGKVNILESLQKGQNKVDLKVNEVGLKVNEVGLKVNELMEKSMINSTEDAVHNAPGGGLSLEDLSVVRHGHRGPQKLCSFSEGELDGILALGHSCKKYENRYFFKGAWMDWQFLSFELFDANNEYPIVCIILCTNQAPCDQIPCVRSLHLRRNSTDVLVLKHLLEEGEYDFIKPNFKVRSILDAGANIGIGATIFATSFPKAKIICVEPLQKDYDVLRLNTANYPNIVSVNAALWKRMTSLSLVVEKNPDLPPEWGYMVMESQKVPFGKTVESSLLGVSVHFLMRFLGIPYFDFVKIDIEGSEKDLFSRSKSNQIDWLKKSKLVVVETHPYIRSESDTVVKEFFGQLRGWSKISETLANPEKAKNFEVFRNDNIDVEESQTYAEQIMNQAIGENLRT